MGMQPRKRLVPVPRVSPTPKAVAGGPEEDEDRSHPAGCSTTARIQEDGPGTWEALPLLHQEQPEPREPETHPDGGASACARDPRRRRSAGGEGRPERGEPERGHEGEQGVGGPNMSVDVGERAAPGPGRAKGARAGVNLWGET